MKIPAILSRNARNIIQLLAALVTIIVITLIFLRLQTIGWSNLIKLLPDKPLFYILLCISYFSLPLSELLIYRICWSGGYADLFPVLLRKRVLNEGFVGYSGEAYLVHWVHDNHGLPLKQVWTTVKDNNLVSAAVSSTVTLLLLIWFFSSPQSALIMGGAVQLPIGPLILFVISLLLMVLVFRFRKHFITMDTGTILKILPIHIVRLCFIELLQISMWMLILPMVTFSTWLTFVAAQMLITRIPLLPNKDLVLLGIGVTLSKVVNIQESSVAAMLLASTVIVMLLHLLVLTGTGIYQYLCGQVKTSALKQADK